MTLNIDASLVTVTNWVSIVTEQLAVDIITGMFVTEVTGKVKTHARSRG